MTTISELISRLTALEVRLWDDEGYLGYDAPEGALDDAMLDELRAHKHELLAFLRQGRDAASHQQLTHEPHDGILPLAPMQRGLWLMSQLDGGNVAYNVPFVTTLEGSLDPGALSRAFEAVVHRHESLRTTFRVEGDTPVQVVGAPTAFVLPCDDLTALPAAARRAELERRLDEEMHRPFDLEAGPLLRARLLRLAPQEHVLCVVVHHIVCDGWSIAVLAREVSAAYAAGLAGRPASLPPPALQYADFGRWHHERLAGDRAEHHLDYWRRTLAELPTLRLPTDRPRRAAVSFRGEHLVHRIDGELTSALRRLARDAGVSLYAALFSAFSVLLARLSGQDDFAVASGSLNRKHPALESVIGHFFNIAPIRVPLHDDPTVEALLARTQRAMHELAEHEELPFDWVVERLRPERAAGQNPFAQVALSLEKLSAGGFQLPGLTARRHDLRFRAAKLDLALWISDLDDHLEIATELNSDLFDRATVERLLQRYERLLRGLPGDRNRKVSALELLDDAERQLLLVELNRTEHPRDDHSCVHRRFEAHADASPDAVALVDLDGGHGPMTYRELDARADQIARSLLERGLAPQGLVGVFVERSAELVATLLGIHKAGGAFVVLDPEHPRPRLSLILEDTRVPFVITSAALRESLPECSARIIDLDADAERTPAPRPARPVAATDLAYVLYTSGSTGTPNGVLIEHGGLDNSIEAHIQLMETGAGTRHAHVLSFNFDGALAHLYAMICAGGTAVLVPRHGDSLGEKLITLIEREAITHTFLPPAMLAALPDAALPSLHTLVVAGEKCPAALVERWGKRRRMLNLYGPTEASILATYWPCEDDGRDPPIGRPIANMRAYVLDRWGTLAPLGAVGQLALAGIGVARGYLERPEATARKFVANPFGPGTLYLTGDLVRHRVTERGVPALEFIGRIDEQIKIRGHRIEPAEIEHAIRTQPGVGDCIVTAYTAPGAATARLVAYVTPRDPDDEPASALSERLRLRLEASLPSYLVPSSILVLPALPLTLNGKVDRQALPPPMGAAEQAAPRNDVERALVDIWCRVLGLEEVGIHDNFFALGGDSILGIQVIALAREQHLALRAGQLFEHQTIAELAEAAGGLAPMAVDEGTIEGPVPLTPIQRWFFELPHPRERDLHGFDQAVLLEAPAELDADVVYDALQHLVAHHDALRLRFAVGDDGRTWTQECRAKLDELAFEEIDLAPLEPHKRPAALRRNIKSLHESLDIQAGRLSVVALFRSGPDEPSRLLWIVHHLAVDAVSWQVLLADFVTLYRQLAAGQPPALPGKTTSFKRWAERLVELARTGDFHREQQLAAAEPPPPLPLDRPGGANDRGSAASVVVRLDASQTQQLTKDALRPYSLGTHEVLLTSLARALARWTSTSTVWIDVEGHGREPLFDDVDLSRTVGWFTSLSPLGLRLPADPGHGPALVAVKDRLRAAPRHGLGFGVFRYLHPEGRTAPGPRPAVAFNYLGQLRRTIDPELGLRLADEDAGPFTTATSPRPHLIEVNGVIRDEQLEVSFTYGTRLHDQATIARLADDFLADLQGCIAHCLTAADVWTPGDFPLVSLDANELERVVARVGEQGRTKLATLLPLTALQKGMLYHALAADPAEPSSAYTTQIALTLEGTLDVEAFRAAWDRIARRHEALRSCFAWEGLREPVQVVLREAPLSLDTLDWHGEADLERRLDTLAKTLAARPVSLETAPVTRMTLVRTAERRFELLWDSHHILMDGWSMSVLLRELLASYRAIVRQAPPPALPPVSYRDYLRWLDAQDHARHAAYWRERMRGFEAPTPLAIERSVPLPPCGLALHDVHLSPALTASLEAAASAAQVTLATLVAGAWSLVLSRYSGHADVLFGTVVSGRDVPVAGIESMLGLFIHMLPVRVRVDEDQAPGEWLRGIQADQASARAHQVTPLVEIQRYAGVPAGTSLFRSVLVYQDYPFDQSLFSDPDLSVGFRSASDPTHYPIVVTAIPGERLHLSIEYDAARFEPASIERMAGHIEQILAGLTDAAHARLARIPMLTDAERTQVLVDWNRSHREHDRGQTLVSLFERQAARTPDAIAVYYGTRTVAYAELDRRSNRLARFLARRGVVAQARVGVCLDRTDELIVALLAILKAGGAYVPIDPSYPLSRQALMVEDSGASLLVSQRGLASDFAPVRSMIVAIDGDAAAIAAEDDGPLQTPIAPEQLAYIIYTSGSTGQPKGVAIEHRNTVAMLHAALEQYPAEDLQGVAACASICFDYSILEIFVPLVAGGAIVLARDSLALPEVEARDRVRLLSLVPSAMSELARAGRVPPSVRAINLAGEKLGNGLVQRAYQLPGVERVYNIYGPTETTTYSTYSLTQRGTDQEPTLGRPIANDRVYVLDARMRPVPIGVPGELYIGGEGVSRGYWQRPELTAERFLDDPFGPGRIYRTGDLGRFRSDGEIEYLGRIDHQVKLRGFRVELGEIEAALERLPGVEQAVVVVDAGGQRLVAHWLAAPGRSPTPAELREQLSATLPAFMVPEIYLRRDALPLTPSGKVDRQALPGLEDAELPSHDDFVPPQTELEQAVAAIWADVLGVERVGAHDNFYRLGGHSLLALTMVLRVESELGHTISIASLFETPSLRELVRAMTAPKDGDAPASSPLLLPLAAHGSRAPVFCVGGFGVHASYLHTLGPALGEDQPLYGIQPLDISAEMPEVTRMEQLATHLADLVQAVQPAGPYTLSGHSAGARLALAIAFELEARGHSTGLVILDMHAPVPGGADQDKWNTDDDLLGYIRQMKVVLGEALAVDIEATAQMPEDQAWEHIARILEHERLLPAGGGVEMLQRTIALRKRVFTLLADYVPQTPFPGRVVLLSVADRLRVGLPRISSEAWQAYCTRPIEAHIVPGDHLSMIREPHVGVVARHLRAMVDELHSPPQETHDMVEPTSAPDPFPVTWTSLEDAEALWLYDAAHCPEPMTRLDFELRQAPMTQGTNYACTLYGLPLRSEPRLINAFVYNKAIVEPLEPEHADAVWRAADAALRQGAEGLTERWESRWLPEIAEHLQALDGFDLGAATLVQLVEHLSELRRRVVRLWEVHFELMYPVTLALSEYDEAYHDLFPDATKLDAYELLAGTPSKTTEGNIRLWEIGRKAAQQPALRELIAQTSPEELLEALGTSAEGKAVRAELQQYLLTYGERNDNMYIDRPTWIEAPIAVLRGLKEAVLQPDRDLGAELEQQARRRDARVREVREHIAAHPRPVIEELESLLSAAQASTHLCEEHNFWIDAKITFRARRACLEVGRRLVERGAIDSAADVFHFGLHELAEYAKSPAASTLRERVAERRAELSRFAGIKPPPFLGQLRPFMPMDSSLMRAMARANGGGVPPSSDPGVLNGMSGASGKAIGTVRVVPTLADAGKLQPGDVLVTSATLPSWTPYFAITAAVVTDSGGMLCHAAVVAREYRIPAVVGTRAATQVLRDGQVVEVDGDAGTVRVIEA